MIKWLPDEQAEYEYHWQVMQDVIFNNTIISMAEVGVLFGDLAVRLLPMVDRYIMVDPWTKYPDEWREADSLSHYDQEWWDRCYATAMRKTQPWALKREVYRMTSIEAAQNVKDESLDLVFIDALHHYEPMMQDIKAWLPKVQPRGILAGHDWWGDGTGYAATMEGVMRALLDNFPREIIHVSEPDCLWDHVWFILREDIG